MEYEFEEMLRHIREQLISGKDVSIEILHTDAELNDDYVIAMKANTLFSATVKKVIRNSTEEKYFNSEQLRNADEVVEYFRNKLEELGIM